MEGFLLLVSFMIFFYLKDKMSFIDRILMAFVAPYIVLGFGGFLYYAIPIFWHKYHFYIISAIVIIVFIALIFFIYKIKPKTKKIQDDDIPTLGADINDFFEQDKQERRKKKNIDDIFKKLDDL